MADLVSYIRGLSLAAPTAKLAATFAGLALFVALLVVISGRSRLMMRRATRILLVAFTGTTLLMLALAFGDLTHTKKEKHLAVAVLVDGSASIPDEAFDQAKAWVEQARQLRGEAWLRTLVFGPAVQQVTGDQLERPEDGQGTNIARALHQAIEMFPEGYTRRAVLLTDGNQTTGDLLDKATLAAAHGIELYPVVLDTRADRDIYVEAIHVPARARPGERVKVGVVVVSNYATRARLRLTLGGQRVFDQTVDIEPGENTYENEATVKGENSAQLVAEVTAEGDMHAENNRLAAAMRVDAKPTAALFSARLEEDLPLVEALDAKGIQVRPANAAALPSQKGALSAFDVVIVSDLDFTTMAAGPQNALMDYVREGGGVLAIGGENTGKLGKKNVKAPIEKLLPVTFKEKKKTEPNPVTLVLIIDKSASMARQRKFAMAVQAANETIDALSERSFLGEILFDDFPRWAIPLQKVGDEAHKKEMQETLRTFGVDGGTSIYPAIAEAYKVLKDDPAKVKHIILLSDGMSLTTFDQWGHLVEWMGSKHITISTVALGTESDRDHLRKIASVGKGRFYYTEDFTQIPRIFLEETKKISKTGVIEKKFKPEVLKKGDLLDGIDPQTLPFLTGYNPADPKPTGEVFLTAERGEPLLARWRFGLGRVTTLATDSGATWAHDWRAWPRYADLLANLVRGTMGDLSPRDYRIEAETDGDQARIAVDTTDPYGNFVNDLDLNLTVTDPQGEAREVPLKQTRPGGYDGRFAVEEFGTYSLRVAPVGGGPLQSQGVGQVNLAPPREFVATVPNRSLLEQVAKIGKGEINPAPATVFATPETAFPRREPLRDWMLYIALGSIVICLLIRRGLLGG